MKKIYLLALVLTGLAALLSCGGSTGPANTPIPGDSPTEAYKRLFNAVKAKDTNAIREQMTRKTIEFGEGTAKQFNKSLDEHFSHGFTATTFSDTLPQIRDERIRDDMGAVEVWNSKESTWDDVPFMLEDGRWRLAIGDNWAGTYKSPGKGRDQREKEAANMLSNTAPLSNTNTPTNVHPKNAAK